MWIRLLVSGLGGVSRDRRIRWFRGSCSPDPLGIIGLAVAAISARRSDGSTGAFRVFLTVAFMVAGYAGADPVMSKMPFHLLGYSARRAIALALVGYLLWGLVIGEGAPEEPLRQAA